MAAHPSHLSDVWLRQRLCELFSRGVQCGGARFALSPPPVPALPGRCARGCCLHISSPRVPHTMRLQSAKAQASQPNSSSAHKTPHIGLQPNLVATKGSVPAEKAGLLALLQTAGMQWTGQFYLHSRRTHHGKGTNTRTRGCQGAGPLLIHAA